MDLYDYTALQSSKIITTTYSTSFTLGIKTLNKEYHMPIYAIYGYVRYADEIVDTFHGHDKKELLLDFKNDTYKAIYNGISLNPVLHSFQLVVNEYKIGLNLIEAFLSSMEMDLTNQTYDNKLYQKYIYGSAEAIGLMCLKVFCKGNTKLYNELIRPARALGAAFQKVNFLRDMKSDFVERGRVYFPNVHFDKFDNYTKKTIEKDIQNDFNIAYEGIKRLPAGAKMGVYLAYIYYTKLFKKIQLSPVSNVLSERIRIPNEKKIWFLLQSYFKYQFNTI